MYNSKNLVPEVIFMSAERKGLTPSINDRRTQTLEAILLDLGCFFIKCKGVYKGNMENSFMVYLRPHLGHDEFFFKDIAKKQFDQECILHRDKHKNGFLINDNGQERIGQVLEITERQALQLDNYTVFPKTGKFLGVIYE